MMLQAGKLGKVNIDGSFGAIKLLCKFLWMLSRIFQYNFLGRSVSRKKEDSGGWCQGGFVAPLISIQDCSGPNAARRGEPSDGSYGVAPGAGLKDFSFTQSWESVSDKDHPQYRFGYPIFNYDEIFEWTLYA
jgi:hypothetical protein